MALIHSITWCIDVSFSNSTKKLSIVLHVVGNFFLAFSTCFGIVSTELRYKILRIRRLDNGSWQ